MINYMTDEEYQNEKPIKFFIITNKNIPIVATKEDNNAKHIEYLQVLLTKYFQETPLNKYIGKKNNSLTEEIINELVNNKNVILSNVTPYDCPNYNKKDGTYARLYINAFTSQEQIDTIIQNKDLILDFDYIEIIIYKYKQILKILNMNSKILEHKIKKYSNNKKKTLKK